MTSKTQVPCDCGWLAEAINDPHSGVSFDVRSNRIMLGTKTLYSMYHCPFCGGRFPDPEGPTVWVPIVPESERVRLEQLIEGLDSPEQIFERLGSPDQDGGGELRCICYSQLSDWFNVEFYVQDSMIHGRLQVKPKSPRLA